MKLKAYVYDTGESKTSRMNNKNRWEKEGKMFELHNRFWEAIWRKKKVLTFHHLIILILPLSGSNVLESHDHNICAFSFPFSFLFFFFSTQIWHFMMWPFPVGCDQHTAMCSPWYHPCLSLIRSKVGGTAAPTFHTYWNQLCIPTYFRLTVIHVQDFADLQFNDYGLVRLNITTKSNNLWSLRDLLIKSFL